MYNLTEILGTDAISGTFGEVWLEGDYVAEIQAAQAKVEISKTTVPRPRKQMGAHKTVAAEGKGSLTMTKVNSRMVKLIHDRLSTGKTLSFTAIIKLDDPDNAGAERVKLSGVQFDDLTYMDWKNGEVGTIETPFTFDDVEPLDLI